MVALINAGPFRSHLQRALADRHSTRIRDILVAHDALACKSCSRGEQAISIHPEPGWGVTLVCEPGTAGCGAVHSVLLD